MKAFRAVGVLALVQVGLVAGYLAVEGLRPDTGSFAVEALDEPAPTLSVERDGQAVATPLGPYLVHFWATWCVPCQAELPALLEAAQAQGVPLVAVTDEPWPTVRRYFDQHVPDGIVRDPTGDAAGRWRVAGLPDTFVVRDGRVVGRMGGARDWTTREAKAFLLELRRSR